MTVGIEGEEIVIRTPIDSLSDAFKGAVELGRIPKGFVVTDQRAFAQAVLSELLDEDEQGTTIVHELFDQAMNNALENGADGVDEAPPEPPECEECGASDADDVADMWLCPECAKEAQGAAGE